jgi:TetR/AcrR family transcriptional regulator, tetracycline repressor protein
VTPPARRKAQLPDRPTRPALTREYILRTALALIDRDGVAAFSMRRLGAELGVDPMAIYHYLPNKAVLFDGIVERIWAEVPLDTAPPGRPWTEQAATAMRQFRAALRAHPRAVPIVGTHPAVTPTMLDLLDHALGQLTGAGLAAADAIDLLNCLAAYTIGHVLAELGEPVGGQDTPPETVYAALTLQTHPHLVAAFAGGYGYQPDQQFERGLTALIAGWADQP